MLTSSNFKRYLAQFNELIAEGEAMYKAIEVKPAHSRHNIVGELIKEPETQVLDGGDYNWQKWQTNYKLLLDKVIPLTSSQRTLIEESSRYKDLKRKLKDQLSNLKAVKENYEKGLLISSQS